MTPVNYFYVGFIFGILFIVAVFLLASKGSKRVKDMKEQKRVIKEFKNRKSGER